MYYYALFINILRHIYIKLLNKDIITEFNIFAVIMCINIYFANACIIMDYAKTLGIFFN